MTTSPITDLDRLQLSKELEEIEAAQRAGKWEWTGTPDDPAKAAHEATAQAQIRRAIEIITILRRTNTGPAHSTSARRKKSPAANVTQIDSTVQELNDLLS